MSTFQLALDDKTRRVFTSEFPTIDGRGMEKVISAARRLAPLFDAVNATDNPAAHAHASNVAVAIAMKSQGLEPIMQIVCRDKNRLAIQSDMMGAALHGIENLCLLTGDDVTAGDEPESRRVFDLDAPQAINVAQALSKGHYLSGRKINPAPKFFIGAVENAGAPPLEYRVERTLKKFRAGARFLQLQICFHAKRLENYCAGVASSVPEMHLLPTVVILKGARGMNFIHAKVPGIDIPREIIERVEKSSDPAETAYQVVLEQSLHALSQPNVRGLHIADFRHDESLERLMNDLGRIPRQKMGD